MSQVQVFSEARPRATEPPGWLGRSQQAAPPRSSRDRAGTAPAAGVLVGVGARFCREPGSRPVSTETCCPAFTSLGSVESFRISSLAGLVRKQQDFEKNYFSVKFEDIICPARLSLFL